MIELKKETSDLSRLSLGVIMKTYLISYGNGNISISKIIKADSEKNATEFFLEMYDQYDISSTDVDVLECEEFNQSVVEAWKKIKELKNKESGVL
jgi:hypothetical protein